MAMNGKKIMKPERIKRENPDDGCMEYKEKEVVEDTTTDSMSDEEKMQLLSNHSGLFRQIAQAIPGLKRFNLTEESKECMKRFLTFQYQTEHFANYYRNSAVSSVSRLTLHYPYLLKLEIFSALPLHRILHPTLDLFRARIPAVMDR